MYFRYNTITIGDATTKSSTMCINKPVYTATRLGMTISIDFILHASSESTWWSNWMNYQNPLTGLVAVGKKLEVFNGGATLSFDPDATSADPNGVTIGVDLIIVGAATDNQYGKICKITFDINMTNVIANGCKNFAFAVEWTPIGQKIVTFHADLPKTKAGSEVSATSNLKENYKKLIEEVLEYLLGGKSKYQLIEFKVDSKDPNIVIKDHKMDYMSVTSAFKQVFFFQETGKQVSYILKDPQISITSMPFVDFMPNGRSITNLGSAVNVLAMSRFRYKVDYLTQVVICASENGGEEKEFDLSKINEVEDYYLKDVFQNNCLPRIEEILKNSSNNGTDIKLINANVRYDPVIATIYASLEYDSSQGTEGGEMFPIAFEQRISIDQVSGYAHKYTDGEDDSFYIDRPGRQTIITVRTVQEAFIGTSLSPAYKPTGCEILGAKREVYFGSPKVRTISNGDPVIENTAITELTVTYIKVKQESQSSALFGKPFDQITMEDFFPNFGGVFGG